MDSKAALYDRVFARLDALCAGESDPIALMATIACELYHGLPYCDWAGFYRVVGPATLKIGPYQGGHGCLTIDFSRGICGRCASRRCLINVPDVRADSAHIACSSTTRSELVLPITNGGGDLLAVLDLDADRLAVFDTVDEQRLARIPAYFSDSRALDAPGASC